MTAIATESPGGRGHRGCGRLIDGQAVVIVAGLARADGTCPGDSGRSSGPEPDGTTNVDYPFFSPLWPATIVGVGLHAEAAWDEIAELIADRYCALAPKRLVES